MAHEHHDHDHSSTPLRALLIALSITGIVFFAELIGGWLAGSMALMADAMHMLSDAAGLIIAVIAVLVGRRQASAQATYGYRRVEVLAALANAVMVLAISVWIVVEAVRRLQSPAEVQGKAMLIIAVIGLVANALSAWVLHRHRESSINVEGAFLHVLVDLLGSVAVIVAGIVVLTTGFVAADVIASLVIAAMVLPRAWQLMRLSASVLLEQVPAGFDASVIEPVLRRVEGVADIHDLHLWSLDGVNVLTTVHIVRDGTVDTGPLLDAAQHVLREHGIEHSTIQIEPQNTNPTRQCADSVLVVGTPPTGPSRPPVTQRKPRTARSVTRMRFGANPYRPSAGPKSALRAAGQHRHQPAADCRHHHRCCGIPRRSRYQTHRGHPG